MCCRRDYFNKFVGPEAARLSGKLTGQTALRLETNATNFRDATLGVLSVDSRKTATSDRASTAKLAYVLQDPTLLPWRHTERNVALPLELRRFPNDEIAQRVTNALNMVG